MQRQQLELINALQEIVSELIKNKHLAPTTSKEGLVQSLVKTLTEQGITLNPQALQMTNVRNKLGLSLIATNDPQNKFDIGVLFKNPNEPGVDKQLQNELSSLMNKMFEKILEAKPDKKMSAEDKQSAQAILDKLSELLLKHTKDDPKKLNNLILTMLQLKQQLDKAKPGKKATNDNVEPAKDNDELFVQLFGTSPVPGSVARVVQAVSIGDQIGVVYQGSAQGDSFEAKAHNPDAGGSVSPSVLVASLLNDVADGNINSATELQFATAGEGPTHTSANWPPRPTPFPEKK